MKKVTWFLTDELPGLLENLQADQQPIWGKMNAHQMVEYITSVFRICNETNVLSPMDSNEIEDKMKRHVFQYKNPFPKGLRNPFVAEGPQATEHTTIEEWAFFQPKHVGHHFSQFGLMEKEITPY